VSASRTDLPDILVVEDDHDARVLLRELLAGAGWRVTTAANGRDALTLLRDGSVGPQLVLIDLQMPIVDGWEMIDAMRADPALRQLTVGVQTAQPRDVIPIGVAFVLPKPIDATALLDTVARHLLARAV
jgi:CheY-like chemotaxis protein